MRRKFGTGRDLVIAIGLIAGCIDVGAVFGCSSASASIPATATVGGTATYHERVVLPESAVLEVQLLDVSLADGPATELGRFRKKDPGHPPFVFEIAYDPLAIDQRHTYSIRATIHVDGLLWFTTDTVYPVVTQNTDRGVEVVLRRVATPPAVQASRALGDLPASFEGELPCPDCPGVYYHLDLFEDRVYFLRTTLLGRGAGAITDAVGSWILAGEDGRLSLLGTSKTPVYFRIVDRDTLRKLDIEGRDIDSPLDYDLRRRREPDPIEPRLMMRGMYRYMADAALFEECVSGRRFQVAQEADNLALERAYLEAREEPGEPLMVSLQGRITYRPAMEGDALELTVVPERFIAVRPGEDCARRQASPKLENTHWKLTRLGDQPLAPAASSGEPYIMLQPGDRRLEGSGGCNRLEGSYSLSGSTIEFSEIATTLMACAEGDAVERGLLAAVAQTRSWRVVGRHLDLFDPDGNLLARFEAGPAPPGNTSADLEDDPAHPGSKRVP